MLKEKFRELGDKLAEEIKLFYGDDLVSLVVFGSVARETYRFDSDMDVLIVAERLPRGRMRRIGRFEAVERRMEPFLKLLRKDGIDTSISPIFKTPEEVRKGSPLFLDMVEDASILYDRDGFFSRILDRLRNRLKELGSKRVWRGNAWHWILKPDYQPGEIIEL